jgi:hypothetical protein
MVTQHYRWDFIGLSTDDKPTPATSEKVTDGSTFYCSDNSKLYVWYKNQWYEKVISGGELPIASSDTLGAVKVGDNLTINSETGVLSATDTTYSAFVGTDGETAGTAGLVPAPATTDAGKFLKADGTWDTAGGGSSVTVVQTTGTSQTDVMSQNAVTSMVFNDPNTRKQVRIGGNNTYSTGSNGVAIGSVADAHGDYTVAIHGSAWGSRGIAIGNNSISYDATAGSVAIGAYSVANSTGQFDIGSTNTSYGYNSSNYRLLTGLYDPQSAHDAANKGYVDGKFELSDSAPTTSTIGVLGQLYTDTTNMHTYQCTAISGDTYTWTQRW